MNNMNLLFVGECFLMGEDCCLLLLTCFWEYEDLARYSLIKKKVNYLG